MVEFNNMLLERDRMMGNRQCDVFDDFGNYRFPTDIESIGPNIAYSTLEGYLYSLKIQSKPRIIGDKI